MDGWMKGTTWCPHYSNTREVLRAFTNIKGSDLVTDKCPLVPVGRDSFDE